MDSVSRISYQPVSLFLIPSPFPHPLSHTRAHSLPQDVGYSSSHLAQVSPLQPIIPLGQRTESGFSNPFRWLCSFFLRPFLGPWEKASHLIPSPSPDPQTPGPSSALHPVVPLASTLFLFDSWMLCGGVGTLLIVPRGSHAWGDPVGAGKTGGKMSCPICSSA